MIKIYNNLAVENDMLAHKTFCLSDDMFITVRDYVCASHVADGTCFRVLDSNGKFAFFIQYTENLVLGKKRNDFLDYEKRFLNRDGLDFSLLNRYRTFVFTETEEYSVAIAKLLQKYCPDKKCIFLDKRAKYFVKGKAVCFLPFCGVAGRYMVLLKKWIQGKSQELGFANRAICLFLYRTIQFLEKKKNVCIVATDKDYYWPVGNIYNNAKMMYSILWCKIIKCLGDKNRDKTIVLLDYPTFNEGLVSIVKQTYSHIKWISEKGFIPVVRMSTRPNQYLNADEDNVWEYFFEPISKITVTEALESKKVISAKDNDIILGENQINPYQEEWFNRPHAFSDFNQIVRVNMETKKYMEDEMPDEIREGRRVLGVVMRGTAFRKEVAKKWNKAWRKDIVDAEAFLQACNYYKDELKCEYIFLATEDAEYFEMAKKALGDKILFIDQNRSDYDYANKEYIPLNEALGLKDGKMAGMNYLTIIKSLSECNAMVYNVNCGAVDMARYWNDEKYELIKKIEPGWKSDGR